MTGNGDERETMSQQLALPVQLYGREAVCERLVSVWLEARKGVRALALVSGYSGVGKTAIVQQLRKQVVGEGAAFIGGKHDQVRRSTPYVAIAEALGEFARYLAALPPAHREARCVPIRQAMGGLARVIVDLAPALAPALGYPPPLPVLPGIEGRHRCAMAFCNFIAAASGPDQPLCLFLDDLQWVDGASLDLLRAVLCDEAQVSRGGLLVVATYRDNEVDASHPFARAVADAEAVGLAVQRIALGGLARNEVRAFLTDALDADGGEPPASVLALADVLHSKTAGNPFYLRMLLLHLHSTGALRQTGGRWDWEVDIVARLAVADNVAELMAARLRRLAASVRQTLAIGASLGRSFSLSLLAAAAGVEAGALVDPQHGSLAIAQREGLVDVFGGLEGSVSFGHDRIQLAALALMTPEQQAEMRLTVGRRLLLRNPDPESLGEHIFIVAVQFLEVGVRLQDPAERLQIAQLHLCAGRQARATAAFAAACEFLEAGIALLPGDAWSRHLALALPLYRDAMLSAVTDARHERAATLFDILLAEVDDPVELAECASFRVMQLAMLGRYQAALEIGLEFFGRLGFAINVEGIDSETDGLLNEAQDFLLQPDALEQIAGQAMASDPRLVSASKLGIFLAPTAFFVDMRIHNLMVLRGFSWALRYGPCAATPAYMVRLSPVFISCRQDYSLADRVGQAAIAAARRFGNPHWLGDALFMHALFGSHWRHPLRAALPYVEEGVKRLRETGDVQRARFNITVPLAIECGEALDQVLAEANAGIADARRSRKRHLEILLLPQLQFVLALRGQTVRAESFTDAEHSDEELWCAVEASPMARTYYLVSRMKLAALAGRWEDAVKFADRAQSGLWSITGFLIIATHRYYAGLARCCAASVASGPVRDTLLLRATDDLAQMQAWARLNPQAFAHRAILMDAAWRIAHGQDESAAQQLERAIGLGHAEGFCQDEALAHELAGRLHAAHGRSQRAAASFASARQAFAAWGATAHEQRLAAELT